MKASRLLILILSISIVFIANGLTLKDDATAFDFTQFKDQDILKGLSQILNLDGVSKDDLTTFASIFSKEIPFVNSLVNSDFKFGESYSGCFDALITTICWKGTWEMYLGWKVKPNFVDFETFNVTYIPYARMEVSGSSDSSSSVFKGTLAGSSTILNITTPISIDYSFAKKALCYDNNFVVYEPSTVIQASSSVLECFSDISDTVSFHIIFYILFFTWMMNNQLI